MSEPDFTSCPNWGKGGRYVVDPVTGQRTPVTDDAPADVVVTPPEPIAADVGDATGTEKPAKKGK